jgi:hypothetical protein
MNMGISPDITLQANKLVKLLGFIFLALAVSELIRSIINQQIDYLSLLVLISITAGIFERFPWSRILAIIYSGFQLLVAFFTTVLLLFPTLNILGKIQYHYSPQMSLLFLFVSIFIDTVIIYAFYRSDVKELFQTP